MEAITRVICLLLLLGIAAAHKPSPDEVALNEILQRMDNTANPCDDFQKFSSGNMSFEPETYNFNGLVKRKTNDRMQKVFDRLKYRVLKDPSSLEEKVWLFYNTCLTAPKFTHSWKHYIGLVPPGRGLTWPHLTPPGSLWPEGNFKWLETLARLRRFGLNTLLIEMKVQLSGDDSGEFKVLIGKQNIHTIETEKQTKDLLITLGVSRKRAGILARDITVLERNINELAELNDYRTNLTIEEFEVRTGLSLGNYLSIAFGSSFDSSFVVETSEMAYLERLQDLMDKFESETVASYLMVSFVRYLRSLDGSGAEGDPRKCAAAVAFNMETASELLYKDFYFRLGKLQRYNDEVQRLFDLILGQLKSNRLNLTSEVAQLTVGKLPNIQNQRRFVNDFYWNLNLESSELDFAVMHLKVLEHRNRKVLEQLDGQVPKDREFLLLSNDKYANGDLEPLVFKNTVILPIDILQESFFTPEMHDVFKVSLLGFILTRQILKSFVPHELLVKGSMMSSFEPKLNHDDPIAWLNKTDLHSTEDRELDVMALKTVYNLYFRDDSKFSQEQPSFTKLPLSQLFLLNFAQVYSGEAEPRDTRRLNQVVKNLQSFGKAFNCPTESVSKE
ncbi:membrane metallo-endopeptidase-like 1 [Drosophila kikkawai]|uniref:Membrane metallo-endopeptidase-like 1 n=1 Tax=Drosophila kikkawai TaxID=30033 RepID=A0A6P4IXA4_DROKI|nr:uncharacterized protein LOC108077941 [Drosophila kikkawai]